MAWTTRGLRGSTLETLINMTNERYLAAGLAVVHKIPTPITPVEQTPGTKVITKAFYERKSTVDYIGVAAGLALCFDAKETSRDYLPLQNIHGHQIDFMEAFARQGGKAFLIVSFSRRGECVVLPFAALRSFWLAYRNGGRASIPRSAFDESLLIEAAPGLPLDYLAKITAV
ncbi:MAG: Holliday junction resolvase RecU [Clostridiales bacterium]|jgi:recombination protein U|nr:Holliday junction resolvase RecU [Clostridiales bacterium]